ncbi:MAG: UDP-galactopyranose mutase [Bacteroidetes bacterium]|nr:UDP-galactopyranose mutase [bacterium]NBP66335.1 UDP-galactopyranose mutase [Bacteroidota bacterium]
MSSSDVVIVGAGLFGLTCANLLALNPKIRILILEKRNHIGGNAYSYFDPDTGIEVHKYGSHLFHTSNLKVWDFVNQFTSFNNYRHVVFSVHNSQLFSMPVNLHTISQIYGQFLGPDQARARIQEDSMIQLEVDNFESKAISSIGKVIYQSLFKGYTQKQWQVNPQELPSSVFSRLPIRFNLDNSYFNDDFQGLPRDGYESFFNSMISNERIRLLLNTDFFDFKEKVKKQNKIIIYTGPIDRYFEYKFGSLGWRTLDFEIEKLNLPDFQGTSVINYPDLDVPFTRIHEFKHLHPERSYSASQTIIMREYSRQAGRLDEPYYPINSAEDRKKLVNYRNLQNAETNTFFGGRLGTYLYLDMHMAIASAMNLVENEVLPCL